MATDRPTVLLGRPRYLKAPIQGDALADHKMAFISGPRQVGKSTLGRSLLESPENERTWDDQRFRQRWVRDPDEAVSDRGQGPILLDEIHKDRQWKSRVKGLHDLSHGELPIIVTGSARLDLFRRGGDSLMGRYLPYRLHPFTVGERSTPPAPDDVPTSTTPVFPWADLIRLGGFPEPLLAGNEAKARRWSRLRLERLATEEVRDLRAINDLNALRLLLDLLPERVGSLLSVNSLKQDLGVAYATVRDWVGVLESLYHVFLIRPYAGSMKRALRAERKLYLYDIMLLEDDAKRRENLTALHLLKACHFWTDTAQGDFDLSFVRTKEKEEVDFLVTKGRRPWMLVECKSGDLAPSPTLVKFAALLKTAHNVQLVSRAGYERFLPASKVWVIDYERFLAGLV